MQQIQKSKTKAIQIICMILAFSCSNILSGDYSSRTQTSQQDITDQEARLELARVLSNLKKYNESLAEYRKLLETQPDFFKARIEMAKVLFYQEKTDEALMELSKIPSQDLDENGLILLGDVFRNKKNYAEAGKIYSDYLEKFPDDDAVRFKLAELYSWEKKYADSIIEYKRILEHRPQDIQVRRRYAQVLTWTGNDEEAIEEWKKSLE